MYQSERGEDGGVTPTGMVTAHMRNGSVEKEEECNFKYPYIAQECTAINGLAGLDISKYLQYFLCTAKTFHESER